MAFEVNKLAMGEIMLTIGFEKRRALLRTEAKRVLGELELSKDFSWKSWLSGTIEAAPHLHLYGTDVPLGEAATTVRATVASILDVVSERVLMNICVNPRSSIVGMSDAFKTPNVCGVTGSGNGGWEPGCNRNFQTTDEIGSKMIAIGAVKEYQDSKANNILKENPAMTIDQAIGTGGPVVDEDTTTDQTSTFSDDVTDMDYEKMDEINTKQGIHADPAAGKAAMQESVHMQFDAEHTNTAPEIGVSWAAEVFDPCYIAALHIWGTESGVPALTLQAFGEVLGNFLEDAGVESNARSKFGAYQTIAESGDYRPKSAEELTLTSDQVHLVDLFTVYFPSQVVRVDASTGEPVKDIPDTETVEGIKFTAPSILPGFEAAINATLSQGTGGEVADIASLFGVVDKATEALNTANERIEAQNTELKAARSKASMAVISSTPAIATPDDTGVAPVATIGHMQAWEAMTPKDRHDEIKKARGHKAKKFLGFDVPVMTWDKPNHEVPAIDTDYKFTLDRAAKLCWALLSNTPVWMHGHTGTGKTTFVEQVAARLGWPVIRVNLDSEITRLDLVGRDTLTSENGATVSKFVEGVLPKAIAGGYLLLLDEVDFARPDVLYVIQSILEGNGMRITEDGGRYVKPHPMFRVIATANTKGIGDEYGVYQGARVLSGATLDRFTCWMEATYMQPQQEMELIMSKCPALPKASAEKLVQLAGRIRTAFMKGEIMKTVSPRGLMACAAQMTHFKGISKSDAAVAKFALDMSILQSVSLEDQAKIQEFVSVTWSN